MAQLEHTNLGTKGLRLRTERGDRSIALGALLGATYLSQSDLEAAEGGRVAVELALHLPGVVALAVDDGGSLAARDAGSPNPQYTLYRVARVPQDGTEPTITYGHSTRLDALNEPCDYASLWTLASPTPTASADDPLDSATGWTLGGSALAAKLDDEFDSATGWTLGSGATIPAVAAALAADADLVYLEALADDWAAATTGGWIAALRWWANSNGPFTRAETTGLAAWYPLVPTVRWPAWWNPTYARADAAGKGALTVDGTQVLLANAAPGFDPAAAWTLFVVAKAATPMQTAQGTLFGAGYIGQASGSDADSLELQCGTASAGIRVVYGDRASRTFAAALSTEAFQILELHAAAGAAVGTWALAVNGVEQTESAVTGAAVVWVGNAPDQFSAAQGWWNSPSDVERAPFKGQLPEILLLQTDDATTRASVRAYLAAKFAINIS